MGGRVTMVTVFWGRHKDEGSLREACDTGTYTTVIISFLDVYGHGRNHLDLSGHDLSTIGADIKHCQHKGVPVSLSVGGFGRGYSLPSKQVALDLFDHLWNSYFGGHKKGVPRPFGDAWLDGVDLFLEHGAPADRYDVLARELAKHNIWAGPGKLLHLTATVPCRFPPAGYMKAYGYGDDYCDWELAWDKWTAAYSGTLIYIGLPASMQLSGWVHPKNVYYGVAPVVQKAPNYGGFMLWHRYYDKQDNYSSYIISYA
ncbi:Xylanase inhibitor protein 1 [Triticum urartu]|uniref:Xylanase inhibitor protein 1 n=1 Tax=Triticum urartu TaxID=4572 RepID=M7ZFW2_TRIUA|nr:Xylanase inhibitor protein 1 [Triticum urartu]